MGVFQNSSAVSVCMAPNMAKLAPEDISAIFLVSFLKREAEILLSQTVAKISIFYFFKERN